MFVTWCKDLLVFFCGPWKQNPQRTQHILETAKIRCNTLPHHSIIHPFIHTVSIIILFSTKSFTVQFGDRLLSNLRSFTVQFGDHLWNCTKPLRDGIYRNHLRSSWEIIYCTIWDDLRSHLRITYCPIWDHLRSNLRIICGAVQNRCETFISRCVTSGNFSHNV